MTVAADTQRAADGGLDRTSLGLRTGPVAPLLVAVAAAVAGLALATFDLGYDSWYALVWGREIGGFASPDYGAELAPTPHPLFTLVSVPLALLGDAAAPVAMSLLVGAAWVALCVAAYLLVGRLFGAWAGATAAVLIAFREPLLSLAARGFVDVPFLALVIGAAALEVRRPRAGLPVLALLAAAGLLRPEAWALSGLYCLWLWREGALRAPSVAVAVVGPVGWALFDLVTTGDALYSLTGTQENVEALGRATGLDEVPWRSFRLIGYLAAEPGIVGAVFAIPLLVLLPRRTVPLAALFAAGIAVFAAYGLAGLPLISRYLTVPAIALIAAAAAGLWAWRLLGEEWRRVAGIAAAVAALALAATVPVAASRIDRLRSGLEVRSTIESDLASLARDAPTGPVLERCPRIYLPNHRAVPMLAWWLDRPPSDIASAAVEDPGDGAFVAPATRRVANAFILDRRDPRRLEGAVPDGFREVARNPSWVLYARGC